MRLTASLLSQAQQNKNACDDLCLILRGYKIPTFENLGATNDMYEAIDASDNDLLKISNLPPMRRLKSLILCNNYIAAIDTPALKACPSLKSLVMSNNRLSTLADLWPLIQGAPRLERLALLHNPVQQSSENYRNFLIYHLPRLRFLDFQKIKKSERDASFKFFASEKGKRLIQSIIAENQSHSHRNKLARVNQQQAESISNEEQHQRNKVTSSSSDASKENVSSVVSSTTTAADLRAAIEKASTAEEIEALERQIKNSHPSP